VSSALQGSDAAGPKAATLTAVSNDTASKPVENLPHQDQLEDSHDDDIDMGVFTDGKGWSRNNMLHFN
jgi:hypothetical protein